MKIVVTGFGAFPGVDVNLTERLIDHWKIDPPIWPWGEQLLKLLPTEYARSAEQIRNIVRDAAPAFVVMFGVAADGEHLALERFALNIDDNPVPDNNGEVREGIAIVPTGPSAIMTTVNVDALEERLLARGINARISNHAGCYVCNHAYYAALHDIEQTQGRTRVLLVHMGSRWTRSAIDAADVAWASQVGQAVLTEVGRL